MRHKIDYKLIEKRAKCQSSLYCKNSNCDKLVNSLFLSESKSDNEKYRYLDKLLSECKSKINANKYFEFCLETISTMENQGIYMNTFINEILPYIENVEYVKNITPTFENLNETYKADLLYYSDCYAICDRLISNHTQLQEQFDIDELIQTKRNKGSVYITKKICDIINENDNGSNIQKFNVALEESLYSLQKHHIKYNGAELVKFITEYFLMNSTNIADKDIELFKNVLNENSMIDDINSSSVNYITKYDDSKSNMILSLNKFIIKENKDIYEDFGAIIRTAPLGFLIDRKDFVTNFGTVLEFVQNYLLNENFDFDDLIKVMGSVQETICEQMSDDTWNYTRGDLDKLVEHYSSAINSINTELNDSEDHTRINKLVRLKDCYIETKDYLNELRGIVYTDSNINQILEMTILSESSHAYYLNEFKLLKFQNLIKASIEAEKFIKSKGKKLMDKIAGKVKISKKRQKKLSESSIYGTFTENNTCNICVCSFDILEEWSFYEVHDVMTEMCRQINENIVRSDDFKSYYLINSDTVEIRMECTSTVFFNDKELNESNSSFSVEDMMRCLELNEIVYELESADVDLLSSIKSCIESKLNSITEDQFNIIIEASRFIDIISNDDIIDFFKSYKESHDFNYIKESIISDNVYNYNKEKDVPISIQIEACNIITAILESEEKEKDSKEMDKKSIKDKISDKIPKKKDNNENKNPLSKVNLNSLKLYTKGLKAKMKDMSSKEREWSRNVDMNFNRLHKACKDMLISDRREAIIKGSIIPSFSKCIKLGIGLAGLTFINPVASAVTAIAGIAMSKNLTKKERMLLLDEISTEIEVVDKEISIAEGKNNMKKYRKLLQYKKDLQRQYQRIRYNIRIGKDILPGSTTGMKDTN